MNEIQELENHLREDLIEMLHSHGTLKGLAGGLRSLGYRKLDANAVVLDGTRHPTNIEWILQNLWTRVYIDTRRRDTEREIVGEIIAKEGLCKLMREKNCRGTNCSKCIRDFLLAEASQETNACIIGDLDIRYNENDDFDD